MEDVSSGETKDLLQDGRGQDLFAHNTRLKSWSIFLYSVKDDVGILVPGGLVLPALPVLKGVGRVLGEK
jgi:hypothetical protein